MSQQKKYLINSVVLFIILLPGISGSNSVYAACDDSYDAKVTVPPSYPRRAQERGIQGYAVVQFNITTEGKIKDIEVIESEPQGIFDRSAIKATNQYQYDPCIEDGQPVEIKNKKLKFNFQLQ